MPPAHPLPKPADDPTRLDERLRRHIMKTPRLLEDLFDNLPDVLVYVKDIRGRYLWVNAALVERGGIASKADAMGKTSEDIFPASGITAVPQDMGVMRTNRAIRDVLRLYRTAKGERYWCLSSKFPMLDDSHKVIGLVGISRDLPRPNDRHRSYHRLARFLEYIDQRLDQNVLIADAAAYASLSIDTLGRLTREVLHVTPKQILMKKRIDKSCFLLEETDLPIADVSAACGYTDHSAFTRQFKAATLMTPMQYRTMHHARATEGGSTVAAGT